MRAGGCLTALAIAATALAITGCGGGDSNSGSTAENFPPPTVPTDAPQPPKGASPVLFEIYRQFTPPQPDPKVKGSAEAIVAGKKTCKGKTPVEIERKYYAIAVQNGQLDPSSESGKMIADIDKYAKNVSKDSSFVAGQLAADAYQATLPQKTGQYGYQGCIYVLARQLEQQLAPKKK